MLYGVFTALACCLVPLSFVHGLPLGLFASLTVVLGIAMGIGNSTVYKHITDYYPKDVGAVGGLVGTMGALGGFLLPLGFGYALQWSGTPSSSFVILLSLLMVCAGWMHWSVLKFKQTRPVITAPAGASPT